MNHVIGEKSLYENEPETPAIIRAIKAIEKHVRTDLRQSQDVILDCGSIKDISGEVVERKVRKWTANLTNARRMLAG